VFSRCFVMRDVIFLVGMAGAGLADLLPVRLMIIFASAIVLVTGLFAALTPGIGAPRPNGDAVCLRCDRRPSRRRRQRGRRRRRLRPPGRRLATFGLLSAAQREAFLREAVVRDVPEGCRVITHGDQATSAYFILEGATAAGVPEPDGGYRGLSTMGSGDFFGEIGG